MTDFDTEESMTEMCEKRLRQWLAAVLTLGILVVLYVAGIGPAEALMNRVSSDSIASKTLSAFYWPIIVVCERVPTAEDAVIWYCDRWERVICPD